MPFPRTLRRALVILGFIPITIFLYVTISLAIVHRLSGVAFSYEHNGTDLTFASSDGGWHGEEDLLKGRAFADVLLDFELYRLRVNRPDIQLLRTKPWKKPWQWAWWFDRRDSLKWKVPYVSPGKISVAPRAPLAQEIVSAETLARARREAQVYLETLR